MKPLSKALVVFKNKANMSVGCVLPVRTLLNDKLEEMQRDKNIVNCVPLVSSLLNGIEKRFEALFRDDFFHLAALSDPHFKLIWVPDDLKITDIQQL